MAKGKIKYVPPRALEAINTVRMNYNYDNDADAFNKMAEFVPVGIEIEKKWFTIFTRKKR